MKQLLKILMNFLKRVKGDFDTEIYNILSESFR